MKKDDKVIEPTKDEVAEAIEGIADEVYAGNDPEDHDALSDGEVEQESGDEEAPDPGKVDTYEMPAAGEAETGEDKEEPESEPEVIQDESVETPATLSDCITGDAVNTVGGQLDLAIIKYIADRKQFLFRLECLEADSDTDQTTEAIANAAGLV